MTFFAQKLDKGTVICDAVFPNDQTKAFVRVTINDREEPIKELRVRRPQKFSDVLRYGFEVDDFINFYSKAGVDGDPEIHQLNFDLEIPNPSEDTFGEKSVAITCLILIAGEVKFAEVKQ